MPSMLARIQIEPTRHSDDQEHERRKWRGKNERRVARNEDILVLGQGLGLAWRAEKLGDLPARRQLRRSSGAVHLFLPACQYLVAYESQSLITGKTLRSLRW